MLILQDVAYAIPHYLLFGELNFTVNRQDKITLIAPNGTGKSTLLKIMAGELAPSRGQVRTTIKPYYVPQHFGQFNELKVGQALRIGDKLKALREILDGQVTETNLSLLNDDWGIEERCLEAFAFWKLDGLELTRKMGSLSGGQKTAVFLAGILIHRPEIVLLDEPSNHLDTLKRDILYDYIRSTPQALVVVSHDRTLLNLLPTVCELGKHGLTTYGGNYEFYKEQKAIDREALDKDLKNKEKRLRKAKETEREALERQQKLDARGKNKQEKAGLPTISMNTFKNNAEKSTARMKEVHADKVDHISQELNQLRKELPDIDKMKMELDDSWLHKGKTLITAKEINFGYQDRLLWTKPLNFQIRSGDRLVIRGSNGSGKTTLIKIILGELEPRSGSLYRSGLRAIYIDQDYSLIDDTLTVYEQASRFNTGVLEEHEIKIRLTRFLFTQVSWNSSSASLSGGEKMRLMLCCLTIGLQAPDIIILDEPTNNLDIQNIEILTAAINDYKGTVIVVTHDDYFLQQLKVENSIDLNVLQ